MRRLQFGILGSTLSALALGLFLAGCSKEKEKEEVEPGRTQTGSGSGKPKGGAAKFVEVKGTGTLKGKIVIKGEYKAELEKLTKNLQARFDEKADDKPTCLAGTPEEKTEQTYRIGANKQVGNVFVWLLPPDKTTYFKIDEKQIAEAKAHPVVIDQPHCAFLPHVAVLFPMYPDPKKPKELLETGQTLVVENGAPISHNTHWSSTNGDQASGNQIIPSKGTLPIKGVIPDNQRPLGITCDIHKWMDAHVWAFDHPYATVSKSDTAPKEQNVKPEDPSFGTYEIKGVPVSAGAKLRIVAWHEKNGFITKDGNKGEEIDLKEGDNTHDFEMEVKP
jgi:hypothetical protein